MSLIEDFGDSIRNGLVSRTLNSCSRWVTHRRVMGYPLPGPYSFKFHPWCREIHDSKASFNTIMKGAQLGLTEVAINLAFFTVDVKKRDVLYVLPTALNASDFAKSRFNTALLNSPHLNGLFTDTNTIGLKQAGGVNLYIRGSRGDSNLKSIPVSVLILDEMDEMDQKQIWLAFERLSGQIEKSVLSLSTPKVPKTGIHKLYLQGTQEHFFFKCPRCGRKTEFVFPDCLEICGDDITDPDVKLSFLKCKECKKRIEQEEKSEFLKDGFWQATAQVSEDHRSFNINQLYSYTVTASDLAIAHFRGLGDEAAMVEYHNSKQGLPYIPEEGQITDEDIDNAIGNYVKSDQYPTLGTERCIVMGIDQGKRNNVIIVEYMIRGGGGDINAAAFAKVLWEGEVDGNDFSLMDHLMWDWQVKCCVLDADPQINDARRFARRFPNFVYLCRYRRGPVGKEIQISEEDSGAPIITVDRSNWLDATLGRFKSNRISLPTDSSNKLKTHLKNLVRTYEKDTQNNPRAIYINTGDDHFTHALAYAEMAFLLAAGVADTESINESVL